jgi:hypothetical protein
MSARARKPKTLNLKDAFETEFARRELERRAKDEADRRQQEIDLEGAETLFSALVADPQFLEAKGLTADRRRYTVSLDHQRFRIAAYFEGGLANITLADKRAANPGLAPRKQEAAESVEDALRLIAQYLTDEIR